MEIKHCKHCEQLYSPLKDGAGSILCRKCLMDSDAAYLKVRRFITENRNLPLEEAAAATNIPQVFLEAMVLDGKFEVAHVEVTEESLEERARRRQMMNDINEERNELNTPPPPPPQRREKRYGFGR